MPVSLYQSVGKQSVFNVLDTGDAGLLPGSGRSPGGECGNHFSILAGESHGQRSLAGCSPWDCKESDMTEVTEYTCTLYQ